MEKSSVFIKTSKGKAAISDQDRTLSMNARRILIMIDGTRTTAELMDQFSRLTDVTAHLQRLLDYGLIVDTQSTTVKSTNDTVASPPTEPGHHSAATPLSNSLKQLLEQEIIEFMGPMGALICDEVWPGATTLEEALEALSRQLDTPEQAKKFRSNVMKSL